MQRNFSRTGADEDDRKRAQQEAQREIDARRQEEIEGRRHLCTSLQFWKFCRDRRCKRARACAGDVGPCFNHFWPQVPEDLKNKIRRGIELVRDGMPPQRAAIEAQAFVAERRRIAQETMARQAARAAAPPAPEAPSIRITRSSAPAHHVGPRIRGT